MTYKLYLYKDKKKKIDDFFLEYLVPITENIDHLALIEEQEQNFDASAYGKI